jgi:hypothetical protein
VARIGPNTLVTSSPELIQRMNAARSSYTKGSWYAGLRLPPGQDNIFSQMDEKKHTTRRAQMADGVRQTLMMLRLRQLTDLSTCSILGKQTSPLNLPLTNTSSVWCILSDQSISRRLQVLGQWIWLGKPHFSQWML